MAQRTRKPAAAKPAAKKDTAQSTAGAADSAAASADVNPKPQETAMSPAAASDAIAAGLAEPQAQQPAEAKEDQEAAPSPVTGSETASAAAVDQDWAGKTVRVRTHNRKPRRRAGRAFGADPVELSVDDLSDDDIAALLADPALAVELVTDA